MRDTILVPRLILEFERDVLARHTPCAFDDPEKVLDALAITHCELVLIHPFREGNGRVSRLLSTLMALQAGLPLLNCGVIKGSSARLTLLRYRLEWVETTNRCGRISGE